MSGKISTELRVRLAVKPLPKTLIRAQVAGELIAAFGGTDREVEIAQEGISKQLVTRIIIYGTQPATDHYQERAVYSVDHTDGSDTVSVEDTDDRSMIERVDEGLGEAVRRTVARFTRKGLKPVVRYIFPDHIANDPQRFASALGELGLIEMPLLDASPDYDIVDVLTLKPGKDRGQSIQFSRGRRR